MYVRPIQQTHDTSLFAEGALTGEDMQINKARD